MSSNLSDQEQVQLLKEWWKKYGSYLVVGLLLFFLSSYGFRYWRHYRHKQAELASFSYSKMVNELSEGRSKEGLLLADHLMRNHKRSGYATLAALITAQEMVQTSKVDEAKENLLWAMKHGTDRGIRQLARIRLARIFIFEKQSDKALDILATVEDDSFSSAIFEFRGDALWYLGKKDEALINYKKAQVLDEKNTLRSPFLKMKLQRF